MWTRRLSSNMAGIDQQDFVQAFILALSEDTVIRKIQHAVCGQLQQEVAALRDIVKKKDDEIANLKERVEKLENKHDDYEQYSRRNSIRVSGLAESTSEDIVQKVIDLFNDKMKVTPPVTPDQFDRVHRTGPLQPEKSRQVLVKFATYRFRDKVFRSKKNLKEVPEDADVLQQADQSRPRQRIYINEDLTKTRSNLLWHARTKKKDGKIQNCWSWDGTILIKNNVAKIIPVHSLAELEKLVP